MSDRDAYIEKTKAMLDQWNAQIERMQAKADEAEANAKIEYQKQVEDMQARRDEAEAKLNDLRNASDDAWSDMRAGFDAAWQNLSSAFDTARSRFK